MRGLVVAALFLAACVTPVYEDCALTCGEDGSCPQGLSCDGDGWCRVDEGAPGCDVTHAGDQASQCQNATECARAHTCVAGTCHPFCDDQGDCEGDGGACELEVGAGTLACTKRCSPRDGGGCPPGYDCLVFYAGDRGWTDCGPDGSVRYCRVGHTDCAEGESCQELVPDAPLIAGDAWGTCG